MPPGFSTFLFSFPVARISRLGNSIRPIGFDGRVPDYPLLCMAPTTASRHRIGILYMVGAAFFWSLMSVFVKLVGENLPSQQIVLVRAVVTLAYSYVLIRWSGAASLWGENRRLLWLRGLLGFTALSCFFFALTKLPLADATVIHYTNPVFTAVIAAVVLNEQIETGEWIGAVLSLVGVSLIAQPSFLFGASTSQLNLAYVGVALVGALSAASAYVIVRKLRETEHPLVIVFYFPFVATLGSAPTAALTDLQWPTTGEWLFLIVGVAGCAQIAQVFLTKGLHAIKAGRAMAVSYLQIVFATGWGLLIFQEVPDLWSLLGTALVIGGTLLVSRG
jgi:drug/metabolite transporter (DMT)-like permease